jgi:S1 RNA binding domain protein
MSIAVGDKLQGKVTGITNFGAFIELPGGITGLVHISEIAENYVKDINEHLKINDMVTVKVIQMDANGKIGLSIKQATDRPVTQQPPKRDFPPRSQDGYGGRPPKGGSSRGGPPKGAPVKATFDDKVSRFLKDSEERNSSLRKNTESKRGGRGGRRG